MFAIIAIEKLPALYFVHILLFKIMFLGVNAFLVSTFYFFFHFGPYILILPFLVPKPINTYYFVISVSQLTKIAEATDGGIKIL